jgi:hypothetical protein
VLTVTGFCSVRWHWLVNTGDTAAGGISRQTTCPLRKGFWLDGILRFGSSTLGIAWAGNLCDLGRKQLWLKAGRAPFVLYPGICLTTEEKHGKPQSVYPSSHSTTSCAHLAALRGTASAGLLHVSSPRLPGGLQSALGRHSALQVAALRGSLHQLTLGPNCRSVLWCGRRRMESPNPRQFACCQRNKLR